MRTIKGLVGKESTEIGFKVDSSSKRRANLIVVGNSVFR